MNYWERIDILRSLRNRYEQAVGWDGKKPSDKFCLKLEQQFYVHVQLLNEGK